MACKICGEPRHNAATCEANGETIALVLPVGGPDVKRTNYVKVTRRIGERGLITSIFVTFNGAIKADAREAHRLARSKVSVPGWERATVAALRYSVGLPVGIRLVGVSVETQDEIPEPSATFAPVEDERRIGAS